MISKLGFKRLYKLCDFAESLPKEANKHFGMSDYFRHLGAHSHEIPEKPKAEHLLSCGTTACMLGWAMTVPAFRRAGLSIYIWHEPSGATRFQVDGSEEVFGLGYEYDSHRWGQLFGSENKDKTPKAWAKRVRRLLKRWQQPW